MVALKISLRGLPKVLANLKKADASVRRAVAAGVYGLGNEIMTDSKRRVPVDFGALKGSGYVTLPDATKKNVRVEVGYGGPAKAYAVVQHERTEFHHEVGEAKYLENAVNAASGRALERVGEIAKAALDAGQGPSRSGHPTNPDSGKGT